MPSIPPDLINLIEAGNPNANQTVPYHYSFFSFMALTMCMVNAFAGLSLIFLSCYEDKCIFPPDIGVHGLFLVLAAIVFNLFYHDIADHHDQHTRNHIITQFKQYMILFLWISFVAFCMSILIFPVGACVMEPNQYHILASIVLALLVAHLAVASFFTHLLLASPHKL
jgi:hypothetical protein